MSDIFSSLIEVQLEDAENPADFLKVKETLSRIGIASRKDKTLFQSCYILHKQGRYYIVHFLELFMIDGRGKHFSDEDRGRRNTIANLLEEWGLLRIVNPDICVYPRASMKTIKVVPYKEKNEWTFEQKYNIGRKD